MAIFYPVFAQIILTLVLMLLMGMHRRDAIRSGAVTIDQIALNSQGWPDKARKFGNCYSNQFELPVIFYVLCLIAEMTHAVSTLFLVLAWTFVISRIAHAIEHTGPNVVLRRGAIFTVGFICVLLMLALLLLRFLLPSGL